MKLHVMSLALTAGILWGGGVFLMTWWVILWDGSSGLNPTTGEAEVFWLSRFYRGYTISPMGSVIGLVWAVPDGLIGGAAVAWVYNRFVGAFGKTD